MTTLLPQHLNQNWNWFFKNHTSFEPSLIRIVTIAYSFISYECFNNTFKNAGHDMAIVREPRNVDAHANISDLFMTMLCPRLCVLTVTVQLSCWLVRALHPSRGHHTWHTRTWHTQDTDKVKWWARVPRLKKTYHVNLMNVYCHIYSKSRVYHIDLKLGTT